MAGSKDNGLKSLAAALNGLLADYFALYLICDLGSGPSGRACAKNWGANADFD
jgi:hypothetical protein